MTGIELIAAERTRQIEEEGYSVHHDDRHSKRELQWAALAYIDFPQADSRPHFFWPWDAASWKPTGIPLRDLAMAGALIAAEMDRLLRIEARNAARGDARPTDKESGVAK